MNETKKNQGPSTSRRDFLKTTSGALAGAALTG
ncbi:MAG: twin-arginine translocation signal domain-containing protein, partial [Phycisphaerales bacterium]